MNWSARPFVRIFLFYVAGILLAWHLDVVKTFSPIALLVAMIILLCLLSVLMVVKIPWQFRWFNGVLLGLAIMLAGMFFTLRHFERVSVKYPGQERHFVGVIEKQPVVSERSVKSVVKITATADSAEALASPLKIMAYFENDSLSSRLMLGDVVVFNARLQEPPEPNNPSEFDYGAYLRRSGIVATVYIRADKWEKLGNKPENIVVAVANRVRLLLLNELVENGLHDREFAVAAAVLLGYDDQMDTELQQDYVTAGAMHILCVSGLHVGIVYLVLNFILSHLLGKRRWAGFIKMILLLAFIWAYALLTGLAPSVWRASLMLSIFIIGSSIRHSRDSYNTLAAAAVIMLVINPMLIFNLGFQLSYSAVLGILVLYRPIYTLFYIRQPFFDKIWSIVAVSTAAQLGTFPLAAHYFHYLPTYFWLSNILIFPLSFSIIVTGMTFMAVFWIPLLNQLAGFVLSSLVYVMNLTVGMIKYLPGNGLEHLYFPWIIVLMVYGLIVTLYYWLLKRNIRFILPSAVLLLGIVGFVLFHHYQVLKQNRFIVYSINKASAIDLIRGKQHCMISDTALQFDPQQLEYHLKTGYVEMGLEPAVWAHMAGQYPRVDMYFDGEFGRFSDFSFMITRNAETYYASDKNVKVDLLIVQGSKPLDFDQLSGCVQFDAVVLDGSVPFWKRKKLMEFAAEDSITCYDLTKTGAYVLDFSD